MERESLLVLAPRGGVIAQIERDAPQCIQRVRLPSFVPQLALDQEGLGEERARCGMITLRLGHDAEVMKQRRDAAFVPKRSANR